MQTEIKFADLGVYNSQRRLLREILFNLNMFIVELLDVIVDYAGVRFARIFKSYDLRQFDFIAKAAYLFTRKKFSLCNLARIVMLNLQKQYVLNHQFARTIEHTDLFRKKLRQLGYMKELNTRHRRNWAISLLWEIVLMLWPTEFDEYEIQEQWKSA